MAKAVASSMETSLSVVLHKFPIKKKQHPFLVPYSFITFIFFSNCKSDSLLEILKTKIIP